MSDQNCKARFSLKQFKFLVAAVTFAVFLTLIPFPWPAVGFLVTVVVVSLGADRQVARDYRRSSLGVMIAATAVFLAVCYLRDEQPFNMNKVAPNSIISMAKRPCFRWAFSSGPFGRSWLGEFVKRPFRLAVPWEVRKRALAGRVTGALGRPGVGVGKKMRMRK